MFGYWKERNVPPSSPITAIKAVKVKGGTSKVRTPTSKSQPFWRLSPQMVPMYIQPEERKPYEQRVRTFVNLLLHTGCDLGDGILYIPDNLEIVKIDKRKTVHVYRYKCRKTGVDAVVPLADWIIDDLIRNAFVFFSSTQRIGTVAAVD